MATLELKGVEKFFGKTQVIHDMNLSVDDGELVVFVGPSGCGKSTLLRMIAGLETLSQGEIHIDGQRVDYQPPSNRGIAMVFQSYALYPHKDVRGNLGFSLKHDKVEKNEIERRVNIAADILGLQDMMTRKPRELSGGQRQRVAIGRAIVREPKVFLFDEPLSNLDAALRVHMRVEILKLHQRLKNTMIYVTHDQVEAMTLADRIVVFRAGRVEQIGTPLELYRTPANRFVAGFIGSPAMNFLEVDCLNGQILLDQRVVCQSSQNNGKLTLGARPEHLQVDENGAFQGTVQVFEHLGGEAFVHLTLTSGQPMVAKLDGEHLFRPGDSCTLGIAPEKCHLFDADDLRISQ
ncbi:ABC transporter ATP-binding protein [Granulosicoccus antarcticus]|uniref:Maltose/maltodextrin import ATP-binding protein MalK n=1 Tax=Granulosicoccus antarcticus IMCC3135 TaxID=1192854 RepID=A0A2Z2NTE0_9GAMM|nr:sn-glycerol-3-phosphate ABC transporter ATP-binding protein UgpC [Granulosicoccus antarcticus]ASJ70384.1 Maltose/maltodextrin import ATP-binding protein MalK [Granulosicoccus antarcticus IMCC3135]